jgi:hypothetical protein
MLLILVGPVSDFTKPWMNTARARLLRDPPLLSS